MIVAIASGKGGTGKTLVATNLFWTLQNRQIPVTLVDCDAEEPNVEEFFSGNPDDSFEVTQHIPVIDPEKCQWCAKCFDYCNYNAIVYLPDTRFIQVVESLCHDCGACVAACTSGAITEKEKKIGIVSYNWINSHASVVTGCTEVGIASPVTVIKRAIGEAAGKEFTLLDSPPGISCPFIATVNKADYVVLVTEPTPFGLHDLKLSVDTLKELGKPFGVIVNRAGLGNRDVYHYLESEHITLLAEIPMDREIARIYSEGGIIAESSREYRDTFLQLYQQLCKIKRLND